ncbi:putative alpha/beta hydrolase-3 [Septoria linicola]|nr:putative alpha/beta hydrolase-3 [Septoria linicola]
MKSAWSIFGRRIQCLSKSRIDDIVLELRGSVSILARNTSGIVVEWSKVVEASGALYRIPIVLTNIDRRALGAAEDYAPACRSESDTDPLFGDVFIKHHPPSFAGERSPDLRFTPLLHPNLKDLPTCYLQVAGLDPLRDEALIYEQALKENGVKTRLEVYDGYGHMFWTNWPELDRSKEFVQHTLAGFRWLLANGSG